MSKSLIKAIILRPQLKSDFDSKESEKNSKKYKQERKRCVKILRKIILTTGDMIMKNKNLKL